MQCGNTSRVGPDCLRPLITRRSPIYGFLRLCLVCDGPAADPNRTNPRFNPPPAKEAAAP